MSENTVVCTDCQTENSPENDFCSNCGLPLQRSAEEEVRINDSQHSHDEGRNGTTST
jgi:predicted amidophosphoribosyltransferase